MIEKILEKALENNGFLGDKIRDLSESRRDELKVMKNKVRTSPDEVEEWFEKEISKVSGFRSNSSPSSSIKNTISKTLEESEKHN